MTTVKKIGISLPADLADRIPAGNVSGFIAEAIREKLARDDWARRAAQGEIVTTPEGLAKARRLLERTAQQYPPGTVQQAVDRREQRRRDRRDGAA